MRLLLPWPRCVWRWLFWLLCVVVTALMLWPQPPASLDVIGWDKANHALVFAALALTGLLALRQPSAVSSLALLAGLLAWGGALEALQSLLPPRHGDWADLLANGVGLLAGALLYFPLRGWLTSAAD